MYSYFLRIGATELAENARARLASFRKEEKARQESFLRMNHASDFKEPPLPPSVCQEVVREVREILGRCCFSVHLVGALDPILKNITYLIVQTDPGADSSDVTIALKWLFLYLDNREELFFVVRAEDHPSILSILDDIDGAVVIRNEK